MHSSFETNWGQLADNIKYLLTCQATRGQLRLLTQVAWATVWMAAPHSLFMPPQAPPGQNQFGLLASVMSLDHL